jgi:hypothetical protein
MPIKVNFSISRMIKCPAAADRRNGGSLRIRPENQISLIMSKPFSRDENAGRKAIASPFGHATLPQF